MICANGIFLYANIITQPNLYYVGNHNIVFFKKMPIGPKSPKLIIVTLAPGREHH
jgi:hypothetical protein